MRGNVTCDIFTIFCIFYSNTNDINLWGHIKSKPIINETLQKLWRVLTYHTARIWIDPVQYWHGWWKEKTSSLYFTWLTGRKQLQGTKEHEKVAKELTGAVEDQHTYSCSVVIVCVQCFKPLIFNRDHWFWVWEIAQGREQLRKTEMSSPCILVLQFADCCRCAHKSESWIIPVLYTNHYEWLGMTLIKWPLCCGEDVWHAKLSSKDRISTSMFCDALSGLCFAVSAGK